MKKARYLALILVWLSISCLVFIWPSRSAVLEIDFLDVGQGDATLIKTPYGQNILIDGGPDSKVLEALADNLPWFDREIDLVILTHQHEDHLAGLLEVFRRYDVDNVIYSSASGSAAMASAWFKALDSEGAKVEKPSKHEKIVLGRGCELGVVNPAYFYHGKDLNEYSLVLTLDCGRRVLLMGDAGLFVEDQLLKEGFDLEADVLKVGHHGSLSASGNEFLKTVRPSSAVISVGEGNSYKLPKDEIIRRLEKLGTTVKRTDKDGTVVFKCDSP